ncbi:MAG TPA: alpha/beta fold hydrolase [Candidatus Acidoferrales bacterium]|nr:alpha/beta fold hydrolase [Candidatus Acidoferrales bacterium]
MNMFKRKWWEMALAAGGIICLILGTMWIRSGELPEQRIVLNAGGCHTPATILNPRITSEPPGTVIVLHGLSANRRIMTYLASEFAGHGLQVYTFDFPGHGDSTDAFSFAKSADCAAAAIASLSRDGRIDTTKTVLVGHSMGGAIAIGMADRVPVAATIAISPAPMVLPKRMPSNLLVFSGEYELATLHHAAAALLKAAGENRASPEDFAENRAFDLRYVARATHTSLITDRNVAHQSERWIMQTLFPDISPETLALNLDLAPYATANRGRHRLAGAILGLIGILILFPFCATLVASLSTLPHGEPAETRPPYSLSLAEVAVAALGGVLLLAVGVPLRFLHMYTADYLLSLLLIVGLVLLILNRKYIKEVWPPSVSSLVVAAILGFGFFLAIGGWMNWQLDDAWLNSPRWLRFAAILPITYVFCSAEELMLGPVHGGIRRALRFGVFALGRLEIFLACTLAYYQLMSGQVLIPLLFVFLVAFSILQRLAADGIRKRTGSSTAAILLSAILAAWFIAAVFPLT